MLNTYSYYFQIPKSAEILGFHNYKLALAKHNSFTMAGPVPAPAHETISRSTTTVSNFDGGRILLDFYNSDSASDRKEPDILLCFDSGSNSVDEDLEDLSGHARKPGERYSEFDFDFLHERWLDINDESSDQISDSDSTD